MCRNLRSYADCAHMWYLYRPFIAGWWLSSMSLSGPGQSVIISQLRLVLEFRKGHYPPTNIPLRLPPLAHALLREVQQILRFLVQQEHVNFPPLHLTSVKMVEIKARAWSQTVFNFRTFLRSWVPGKPQECACRSWCSSETGHLFAHVRQILPVSPLADLNLNDATFLSDKQWTRIAGKELRMWCSRWRLPDRVRSGLLHWIHQQLILRHRALESDCHELHREVKHDLQVMQGLVFTPADHFPHSLHVACPFAFHELLHLTFLDVAIFRQCTVGLSSILANLKSRFQSVPKWSRRYSWGCKWSASLPVARSLPKPSKGFAKARPIIACDQCWHSRLTAVLAKGVFQIMLVVFPPGLTLNNVVSSTDDSHHLAFHDGLPSHRTYKYGAAGSYWLLQRLQLCST